MPVSLKRVRPSTEGRFSKLANEIYLGVLVAGLVVLAVIAVGYGLSHVVSFTRWVSIND